jgi:elongator complex protein 3
MDFFTTLLLWIIEHKPNKEQLAKKKILLCKLHGHKTVPTDIEILTHASQEQLALVKPYLKTKPMRTGSGVAVIATMSAPISCPHGTCIYCPGGPNSPYGDTPKSYTGKEPSTMRGMRHDFDSYRIIFNRLEQYIVLGQNPDKVEQIIMGGTFPSFPKDYQEAYIRDSFKAYNDFSDLFFPKGVFDLESFKSFFELPGKVGDEERAIRIQKKVLTQKEQNRKTLEEEQTRNETATIRCIGLTIETKPDYGRLEQGLDLLRFGTTRVELGVQTTDNEVLQIIHRGHTVEETKASIAELRDLGFKLNFHLMPGLPGKNYVRVSKEEDLVMLHEIFENPDYKPDMLKIYPCMVMPGTLLEKKYKQGLYDPLNAEEAADIIVNMKQFVPEWCRIMRIQRDIPTYATTAGVEKTNLRQYVTALAKERDVQCRCIRCREIGTTKIQQTSRLHVTTYDASNGKEYFISMEAEDKLLGFARLRFPPRSLHPAITTNAALIRELHVYGEAIAIGQASKKTQHQGIGKELMNKAEELAKEHGKEKILVISGVGARAYYKKIGYHLEGPYMVKDF